MYGDFLRWVHGRAKPTFFFCEELSWKDFLWVLFLSLGWPASSCRHDAGAGAAVSVSAAYRDAVAPEVYDAVLGAVLTAIKRLDLRYTYATPEEGGR